jgi:hypothetical protein
MVRLLLTFAAFLAFTPNSLSQSGVSRNSKTEIVTVTVFLSLDCPISQKYITKLNAIFESYSQSGIDWTFIVPGKVKKRDLKRFAKEYRTLFTLAADKSKPALTDYFGATVTPEVFVQKNGKIVYSGAIDNWFYELGKYRQQTTEDYLVNALESILKNKEPEVKRTPPIGCPVQ